MSDTNLNQSYAVIVARCNDLCRGKFIVAGNSIKSLLRFMASDSTVMGCIAKCNTGIDYKDEFAKASNANSFRLPSNSRKTVALVIGLLYEFDRGTKNLYSFLKNYFRADDIDVSFSMFCNSIITPFVLAFKNVLDDKQEKEDSRFGQGDFVVSDIIKEKIVPYIVSVTETVAGDYKLDDDLKDDYITMLEGFYYAFEIASAKMVKAVWLGLNAVMNGYRNASSYLDAVEKILQTYALI